MVFSFEGYYVSLGYRFFSEKMFHFEVTLLKPVPDDTNYNRKENDIDFFASAKSQTIGCDPQL